MLPVRTIVLTTEPSEKSQSQNGIQIQLLTALKANTGEKRVDKKGNTVLFRKPATWRDGGLMSPRPSPLLEDKGFKRTFRCIQAGWLPADSTISSDNPLKASCAVVWLVSSGWFYGQLIFYSKVSSLPFH